jgi:hypothetical protein
MTLNVKYYKVVLLKNFLEKTCQARTQLFDELAVHAIDPVLYNRRFRMLSQLGQYESQIIKKIQNFETDDVGDLFPDKFFNGIEAILNRSA